MNARIGVAMALLAGLASCASAGDPASAARGEMLFQSKELSSAPTDLFTCATCHDTTGGASSIVRPGAPLAGVTGRMSFWGGMEGDLLAAVNDCRRYFMSDRQALARDDPEAESLYAYPADAATGQRRPGPVHRRVDDRGRRPRGRDPRRGRLRAGVRRLPRRHAHRRRPPERRHPHPARGCARLARHLRRPHAAPDLRREGPPRRLLRTPA